MNIVISGGSRGIGKALALRFARESWNVATYSRNEDNLKVFKADVNTENRSSEVLIMEADATRKDDVMAFADRVKQKWGTVHVLVNNAGLFVPDNITDAPEGKFEEMVQLNLYSAYYLTRALLPNMPKDGSGHIFNLCSIAAIQAYPAGSLYTITKHGLLGFSRALRQELKNDQIRVTNVMPGATYTDSWEGIDQPEERFMPVEDVAEMMYQAYALSPRSVVEDMVIRPMQGDI